MGRLWEQSEVRSASLVNPPTWLTNALGISNTANVAVNNQTSLQLAAVKACVEILSDSIAMLPLNVYQRQNRNGVQIKTIATEHPLYDVLHNQTNSIMNSFNYRESAMVQLLYYGNHYALKQWDKSGNIYGLKMLYPWNMKVEMNDQGEIFYQYTDEITKQVFKYPRWMIFHVAGVGFNGLVGMPPIQLMREVLGNGLALQEFSNRYFSNGTNIGVFVTTPKTLTDPAFERLGKQFNEKYSGVQNAHKGGIILEDGADVKRLDVPPEQAQFLESRKFNKNEIATMFRVPPHMIGDLERATFSNIEQQSMDFVQNTLLPWASRWESAINSQLFTRFERSEYYTKFNLAGLIRGDIETRYRAYAIGRQNGWLSADEIREKEDMNPIEDISKYLVPANMISANDLITGGKK